MQTKTKTVGLTLRHIHTGDSGWRGQNRPYLQIVVYRGMPSSEVRSRLIAAVAEGELMGDWVLGNFDRAITQYWQEHAYRAIEVLCSTADRMNGPDHAYFKHEWPAQEDGPLVYAYFLIERATVPADIDAEGQTPAVIKAWNTGRRYTAEGQRIAYMELACTGNEGQTLTAFYDIDRQVHGVLLVPKPATPFGVLDAYDRSDYQRQYWLTQDQLDAMKAVAEQI